MAPPTFTQSRQAAPGTGQSPLAPYGVQAARMPRGPDPIRNAHARTNEAINALQHIYTAIESVEKDHRGVIEGKDASYASLQQRFSALNALQKTTNQRLNDNVAIKITLTAEIKKLKQELAGEKTKNAADEGMAVLLDDAKRDNAVLTAKIKELEQELAAEKAKTVVDEEARRQLADATSEKTTLTSKVKYLQQELKVEMARSAANSNAKRELGELKTKLAEMAAGGVKMKIEEDE